MVVRRYNLRGLAFFDNFIIVRLTVRMKFSIQLILQCSLCAADLFIIALTGNLLIIFNSTVNVLQVVFFYCQEFTNLLLLLAYGNH